MNRKLLFFCSLVVALGMIAALAVPVLAEGEDPPNQTTLSATKTATGHWDRTYRWTIDKSVDPETLDMFTGDSGDVEYTIEVDRTGYDDTFYVDGEICVTNGGAVETDDLTIVDEIQYKWDGKQFDDYSLTTQTIDLGEFDALGPGESHCYPYSVSFTPVDKGPGVEVLYRNVAHVTITNHAGWLPDDGKGNCDGPDLCPFGPDPKTTFTIPGTPNEINATVDVDDTNGGSWEDLEDGDSVSYTKTFTCDEDEGQHDNAATIRGTDISDDASVTVNCYQLDPDKTVETSFDRTYNWYIDKTADEEQLLLALNQSWDVNYSVEVGLVTGDEYTDSNWVVSGDITITNDAPIDAELTGVTDLVSPDIAASVDCGVTFPYTLAAGDDLVCSYTADLPNADDRTNAATVTLQNHDNGVDSGTTDFSTDAKDVKFAADPDPEDIYDACVDVEDTFEGFLGTVCEKDHMEEGAFEAPHTFTYTRTIGPYTECGDYTVENTATLTTVDNGYTQDDDWTVDVGVPCGGCSLTIGYWKTHAGFGPQPDMVSDLLPQLLGLHVVNSPALAVQYLSFKGDNNQFDASNGINKLYAQLLGAELNIANGADGSAIALKIAEAQLYLAGHGSASWYNLSKNQQKYVLGLMTIFDNYNNGLIGPGHCTQ